ICRLSEGEKQGNNIPISRLLSPLVRKFQKRLENPAWMKQSERQNCKRKIRRLTRGPRFSWAPFTTRPAGARRLSKRSRKLKSFLQKNSRLFFLWHSTISNSKILIRQLNLRKRLRIWTGLTRTPLKI